MRFSIYIYFGILFTLLNSSLCFGASAYLFADESCGGLKNSNWVKLQSCSEENLLSLKNPENELFCQYRLKPGESLRSALTRSGFYRSNNSTSLIDYNTGEASKAVTSKHSHILFSKKDLLSRNNSSCTLIKPETLNKSAYAFHIPNSLYVIKSDLEKALAKKRVQIQKITPRVEPKLKKEKKPSLNGEFNTGVLSLTSVFFYENFKGTQISNGTKAEISSKLSPGIHAKISLREDRHWRYSIFTGVDFHIYSEKVGPLEIANSNVQAIHIGSSIKFAKNKYFHPKFTVQALEDLYYSRQSSTTLGIERELVPRLSLSGEIFLYQNNLMNISFNPTVIYDLGKEELQKGTGYSAPLSIRFLKDSYSWGADLAYTSVKKDLTDLELERTAASFSAYIGLKF